MRFPYPTGPAAVPGAGGRRRTGLSERELQLPQRASPGASGAAHAKPRFRRQDRLVLRQGVELGLRGPRRRHRQALRA